jgi:hypothetical protein
MGRTGRGGGPKCEAPQHGVKGGTRMGRARGAG